MTATADRDMEKTTQTAQKTIRYLSCFSSYDWLQAYSKRAKFPPYRVMKASSPQFRIKGKQHWRSDMIIRIEQRFSW